jgi:hypothetical protein
MNDKELKLRLDNMERMIREMHARVMTGGDAPLQPGDPAIRIAAREFMNGNKEPMKALGKRGIMTQVESELYDVRNVSGTIPGVKRRGMNS